MLVLLCVCYALSLCVHVCSLFVFVARVLCALTEVFGCVRGLIGSLGAVWQACN